MGTSGPTRRQQRRAATSEEIVVTARALLGRGEVVSLRAVAGEMSIAPSALYRYFASMDELQRSIADRVYVEILQDARAAAEAYADPLSQSVAGLCALRRWALTHPPEAQLVFASADSGLRLGALAPGNLDRHPGFVAFSTYFMQLILRARQDRTMREAIPLRQLSARARGALLHYQERWAGQNEPPGIPLEEWWVHYVAWARIVGIIILEVTEQMPHELVSPGALFEEALLSFIEQYVGVPNPQLRAVIDTCLQ